MMQLSDLWSPIIAFIVMIWCFRQGFVGPIMPVGGTHRPRFVGRPVRSPERRRLVCRRSVHHGGGGGGHVDRTRHDTGAKHPPQVAL